jgi:hypothetical protein
MGRNRCGVVQRFPKGHPVKDIYIMPLAADAPIPKVLLPFEGPGNSVLDTIYPLLMFSFSQD